MSYTKTVKFTTTNQYGCGPDDEDDVYTIEEFKQRCEDTGFIDYDGHGYPVTFRFGNFYSDPDILIKPSKLKKIPDSATHIV